MDARRMINQLFAIGGQGKKAKKKKEKKKQPLKTFIFPRLPPVFRLDGVTD